MGVELTGLLQASAESVNEPRLGGFKLTAQADYAVKITHYVQDHGFADALGYFNLAYESLLLQIMGGTFQSIKAALSYGYHLGILGHFTDGLEDFLIISRHVPGMQPNAEPMALICR